MIAMRDGGITPEQSFASIDMCAELGFVKTRWRALVMKISIVFSSAHTLLFPFTIPLPCQKLRVEIIKDRVTPHDAEVTIEIP